MPWVVDTSVLLDIYLADAVFGAGSAKCLTKHFSEGLIICPVSYVELTPAFEKDSVMQQVFLSELGVDWTVPWTWSDTHTAGQLWKAQTLAKRAGKMGKRIVADVLIEAFASRFDGLITRNPKDFSAVRVLVPA